MKIVSTIPGSDSAQYRLKLGNRIEISGTLGPSATTIRRVRDEILQKWQNSPSKTARVEVETMESINFRNLKYDAEFPR